MVPPDTLDAGVRARMARHANGSGTFRINVALSALPRFAVLPEPGDHLKSGIILAPRLAYMDRALTEDRKRGMSGKGGSVSGDIGWRRILTTKNITIPTN